MKRVCILLLALALLLSACGSSPAAETASPETSAPAPESAGGAETPALTPETPAPTPTPEPPEVFPTDFSQVLADTEDCAAEVTAVGLDGAGNWVFHLRMENRSGDIQNFQYLYQSINGLCCESFLYRLAVGESAEREFRVLRETLTAFGAADEVQWNFTLLVSSAEYPREPYLDERFSVCPAGEGQPLRCEYTPSDADKTVMDNDRAVVYVTGVSQEGDGVSVDFVAVNRTEEPIRLLLSPEKGCTVNGWTVETELRDDIGPCSTLVGYFHLHGWALDGFKRVDTIRFMLLLTDPTADDPNEELRGSAVWVTLRPGLELERDES